MKSQTLSVSISATPDEVFDFVSNPENMPRWAVNFCRAIRPNGDSWTVTTPRGEIETTVDSNKAHRIIDFHWRPAPGVEALAPTRVVPNGKSAEFLFTLFQGPDMSDEDFEAGKLELRQELNVLKELLENTQ